MKILHVVHAYQPAIGGTEFLVQQVSEYLAAQPETDISVYTTFALNTDLFTNSHAPQVPAGRSQETINNVKIRRFPVNNRWGRILYYLQAVSYRLRLLGNGALRMLFYGPISPTLKKAIKTADVDIIAAAPFPLNHTNYLFKRRPHIPVVIIGCMHTSDKHGFHNPRIIKSLHRADGYVALTEHEKEYIVQKWGVAEKKIRVIGVGIKTDLPAVHEDIRQKLAIPAQAPLVAFVGQHGLHKGIDTLLAAASVVWQTFPETRFIIAGGTSPFTDSFKNLAQFFDQNKQKIFFLDNIDEQLKSDILCGCDIFATPSGFESFGITILEAWKRKRPVIACRIPATLNLIDEYQTGLLADYKNADELAQAINELIDDAALRQKLGENGHQKFLEKYSWEVVGQKYLDFYREVVEKVNHAR